MSFGAGPKGVGSRGRSSVVNGNPAIVGQDFVTIWGQKADTNVVEGGGAAVAAVRNATNAAGFDPTTILSPQALIVASIAYGQRLGDTELDRIRAILTNADDIAAIASGSGGALASAAFRFGWDGAAWDRLRVGSASVLSALSSAGAGLQVRPGDWSVNHVPAAATVATITRAAGAAGVRHVCTSIDAALVIPATANQPAITLNLRDGATGAGTILWSRRFGVGAAIAGDAQQEVSLSGLNIVGSAATAMTLEFSAAGVATTLQSVAMTGYDAS